MVVEFWLMLLLWRYWCWYWWLKFLVDVSLQMGKRYVPQNADQKVIYVILGKLNITWDFLHILIE